MPPPLHGVRQCYHQRERPVTEARFNCRHQIFTLAYISQSLKCCDDLGAGSRSKRARVPFPIDLDLQAVFPPILESRMKSTSVRMQSMLVFVFVRSICYCIRKRGELVRAREVAKLLEKI